MRIGYARVSTDDQNLNLQTQALVKAGCERVFSEKIGSARSDRPALKEALSLAAIGNETGGTQSGSRVVS